jgi:mono/diheme cytochrome c family protein
MVKGKWASWVLMASLVCAVVPIVAQQAAPQQAPDSATVAAGKQLFEGRGLCYSCHGVNGEGLLGPTTRLDGGKAWLHHDGSLAGIAALIKTGVDGDKSKSGNIMPPLGGARLSDQQVEQVAAYIWTLHRRKPAS